MTTEQLNGIANILASAGVHPTKEMVFAVSIKTLVDAGMAGNAAFDFVLGAGRYDAMVSELYARLTA